MVTLRWLPLLGATNYTVKRALVSGGPYLGIGTTTSTNYTDTTVTNGTTYYYVVSAAIATGESANSSEMHATPQAPLQLTARWDPASSQVSLSWPAWATNYTLYTVTNLTPPVLWQPMTNSAASSSNGLMLLSLPVTNAQQQFFWLKAP